MDDADRHELKFDIEMTMPICDCYCHKPGIIMKHCMPCCGGGTHKRPPSPYDPEADNKRIRTLLGTAYIDLEEAQAKIAKLRKQQADGWTHPEEIASAMNEKDNKIRELRHTIAKMLTVVLESTFDYIEEDLTGARLEEFRPTLQKLADRLRLKDPG
jgi:ribosomal protein L29